MDLLLLACLHARTMTAGRISTMGVNRAPPSYDRRMSPIPPEHREFARTVEASAAVDPLPTFHNLSAATGVPVDALVHHALVRWASAGAEALMAAEPQALRELIDARRREDWAAVAGIVDWLEAGL
jgi:hypothetical protein